MFCPKCGRQIEGAAKFCPSCGAPLEPGATAATRTAEVMWEAAKTTIAQVWVGEASLTLIAVYMVFNAVFYGLQALISYFLTGIAVGIVEASVREIGIGVPAEIRRAAAGMSFGFAALTVATVLAGTGAAGLFARRLWGRMATRAFLVLQVVLAIVSMLMVFSTATFIIMLFTVVIAIFIWIHLSHPKVEALLKPKE